MLTRRTSRLFRPTTILAVAAGIGSIVAAVWLLAKPLGTAAAWIAVPLHAAGTKVSTMLIGPRGAVTQEQYDGLLAEKAALQALVQENVALKVALAYREKNNEHLVTARVVAEEALESSRTLTINKGRNEGLAAGQPVLAGDGIIIGKLNRVGPVTADVLLLTDARSRLAVSLLSSETTVGVLEGERGLSMAISLIPPQIPVAPGDVAVTSGLEAGIRRGYIAGTIGTVRKNPGEPYQVATVIAPLSAHSPLFVQVVVPDTEIEEVRTDANAVNAIPPR